MCMERINTWLRGQYAGVCVCVCICVYICMYAYIHIHAYIHTYIHTYTLNKHLMCMERINTWLRGRYAGVCVCMYMYIYTHAYTYIYIKQALDVYGEDQLLVECADTQGGMYACMYVCVYAYVCMYV